MRAFYLWPLFCREQGKPDATAYLTLTGEILELASLPAAPRRSHPWPKEETATLRSPVTLSRYPEPGLKFIILHYTIRRSLWT